jgi:hypothetical protein
MSSIAVFLVIGGATAFAALGKNTVGPKQLKKNAVTTAKIKNEAITTSKLRNDAATGDKVNESTLGQVPSAANANTVGGLTPEKFSVAGSGYKATVCDPTSTTFIVCTSVSLDLPHAGQVVLVGAGGQNSFAGIAEGTCEFSVNGVASATPSVDPGEAASDNTFSSAQNGFALTSVTGALSAGTHTFALVCNERVGDAEFHDTTISAQLVG